MCLESWPTTTTTRRPWRPSTWRAWSTSSSAASTPPCAATASSRSEGVVSSLAGKAGLRCTGTRRSFGASRCRRLAHEWPTVASCEAAYCEEPPVAAKGPVETLACGDAGRLLYGSRCRTASPGRREMRSRRAVSLCETESPLRTRFVKQQTGTDALRLRYIYRLHAD